MSKEHTTYALIEAARTGKWDDKELALKAVDLALDVLAKSNEGMHMGEKNQANQLARMMTDPAGKALTLAMADRVFRPTKTDRSAEQFRYLIHGYGVPHYLSVFDKLAMQVGCIASEFFPSIVMPAVTHQLRSESSKVILPSEDNKLRSHLQKRRKAGIRMNINQLGEAILGETEASHRMKQVVDRLVDKNCNYISVKISAIFSQIHLLAFEKTIELIQERLRTLYRTAMQFPAADADGIVKPKFVNLDMEEYRDLHLTCEAFKRTLMEEEFMSLEAGIVLQAYLPDSWEEQMKLTAWAKERVEKGGARIKIRLVKGANLAMEKVEASLHGWELAPYDSKHQVDANYKRMLHYGCQPEHAKYVQFGVASHNLFDLCYAMLLREREGVRDAVEFEMLEGMANHQARVIADVAGGLLLYAPVVKKEDFHSAIAYLVRRLDENTSDENFLHDLFGMTSTSKEWSIQKKRFLAACHDMETTKYGPNRKQNRQSDAVAETHYGDTFVNETDTDWSLRANTLWMEQKVLAEKAKVIPPIPLVIGGEEIVSSIAGVGRDPSYPDKRAYEFSYAGFEEVQLVLDAANKAQKDWASRSMAERGELLHKVAAEIGKTRGEAITSMLQDAGKAPTEADVEVSEAIDFCRYYADGLSRPGLQDGVEFTPLGTVAVISPWNFPYAIPCGGISAALMAGNTVIFKPASPCVYTAWVLAQAFWSAGVPRDVLQFVPTPPNEIGQKLLSSPLLDGVILTGSYHTAKLFQSWNPRLPIFAETSGKDSLIITSTADPDQAIKDLVKSAFGHSGQKCSAASLAILEASVYDNPSFMRQLKDAVASLKVGSPWDLNSIVTPIIKEPEGALLRGLTQLDPGEEWLLKPEQDAENPWLWSPGIRIGVKQGSWFHKTECFGPVLGIIRAENLEEAIQIQNDSDFGLTGGLHSLDDREIALWKDRVEVGNAYINRPITGAIVRRQPFGGWKKSSIGPGSKAGGPNYLTLLGKFKTASIPKERVLSHPKLGKLIKQLTDALPEADSTLEAAAGSLEKWVHEEFSVDHDPSQVYGEVNIFRYRPVAGVTLRAEDEVTDIQIALAILSAAQVDMPLVLSLPASRSWLLTITDYEKLEVVVENIGRFRERLPQIALRGEALRYPGCDEQTYVEAHALDLNISTMPVLANGRLELLPYYREQAISETIHRYGNIIPRAGEV